MGLLIIYVRLGRGIYFWHEQCIKEPHNFTAFRGDFFCSNKTLVHLKFPWFMFTVFKIWIHSLIKNEKLCEKSLTLNSKSHKIATFNTVKYAALLCSLGIYVRKTVSVGLNIYMKIFIMVSKLMLDKFKRGSFCHLNC